MRASFTLPVALLALACDVPDEIREVLRDPTSHERYAASLASAGLDDAAAGRDWLMAAAAALEAPREVTLPHREDAYLDPRVPSALGYRVSLRRGQRFRLDLTIDEVRPGRLFIDLYRLPQDSTETPFHLLDLAPDSTSLEFDVPRTGDYVLRVQPELLRGGAFAVELRVVPQLAFPVDGRGPGAILSRFGADRDGGRRLHRGVDIFAPRGTPALAAADGRVTRVDTTALGGNVVWMTADRGGHRLYYAHLDRQLVQEGQSVKTGDTLGLVGNTGNARTTPPHLHFGVYARREGALDPIPFIEPTRTQVTQADPEARALVGTWARSLRDDVPVRERPNRAGEDLHHLRRGGAARVIAATDTYFRVRLPDGREGYALQRDLQSTQTPLGVTSVAPGTAIRSEPQQDAPALRRIGATAAELPVAGLFERFGLVLEEEGEGWIPLEDGSLNGRPSRD